MNPSKQTTTSKEENTMTKSELFKKAHQRASRTVKKVGDYMIALKIELKNIYRDQRLAKTEYAGKTFRSTGVVSESQIQDLVSVLNDEKQPEEVYQPTKDVSDDINRLRNSRVNNMIYDGVNPELAKHRWFADVRNGGEYDFNRAPLDQSLKVMKGEISLCDAVKNCVDAWVSFHYHSALCGAVVLYKARQLGDFDLIKTAKKIIASGLQKAAKPVEKEFEKEILDLI